MVADINFIKLKGIVKLFRKGKIGRAYLEMYEVAEKLAIHENEIYEAKLMSVEKIKSNEDIFNHFDKLFEKREERLKYHIDEMKKLMLMHLKKIDFQ